MLPEKIPTKLQRAARCGASSKNYKAANCNWNMKGANTDSWWEHKHWTAIATDEYRMFLCCVLCLYCCFCFCCAWCSHLAVVFLCCCFCLFFPLLVFAPCNSNTQTNSKAGPTGRYPTNHMLHKIQTCTQNVHLKSPKPKQLKPSLPVWYTIASMSYSSRSTIGINYINICIHIVAKVAL